MKTAFLHLISAVLFITAASAQWTQQSTPAKKNLNDIAFLNASLGYAVGASGTVLKTTDGGNNWVQVTSPDNVDLTSVTVIDNLIFVTTSANKGHGKIYKSKDQGATWRKVQDDNRTFYATATPSKNIYSISSEILRSSDLGKSWFIQKQLNSTSTYEQIDFSDNTNGIVAGNISGILTYSADFLRTTDGEKWYSGDNFSFPNANGFSAFSAINADSVYMFTNFYKGFLPGDSSQLILLTNFRLRGPAGNQLWFFDSKIILKSLQDVITDCKFFSGGKAYAVSQSGVIYTSSKGSPLKKEYSSKTGLNAIYMLDKENGFAAGNDGLILKRTTSNTKQPTKSSLDLNKAPLKAEQ